MKRTVRWVLLVAILSCGARTGVARNATKAPSAETPIRELITSFYQGILGRDPEPGAVDSWESGYFDYAVSFDIDMRFIPREMARLNAFLGGPTPSPTPSPTLTPTPTPTPGTGPEEITVFLPGDVLLTLVRVPAGSFQMGSPDTERSRYPNEGPVHTVNIAYDFYMGKTELTQRQWLALMGSWPGSAPNSTYGVGDNYPAYFISWNDCQNFIAALNQHIANTGQGPATFRLPSEAQWEYACRAGTQTRFFFGDSLSVDDGDTDGPAGTLPGNRSDYMWFGANNSPHGSKPVGTKLPNQFGLYDMSGNVWEWCQDWYHLSYTAAPTDGSAWVSPTGSYRVLRGGDWRNGAYSCRCAGRDNTYPVSRYGFGVRFVRTQ
ncbi:MAG TPA: formylglycine-generating enzyme family protein [Sumerlaeia bacterium]|nr:formylglycine-generating enzyme family protein [Sumerlaeia bacterium]